jgi:hypothetical protein
MLEPEGNTAFLIAAPEKALADKVWADKRFSGERLVDFASYLLEDLRIDEQALSLLSITRLEEVGEAYDSAKIDRLVRYLERMRSTPNA